MSRWKIKLFAFSSSLLIGLLTVWLFLAPQKKELHAPAVAEPTNLEITKTAEAPFEPEFTNLEFPDHDLEKLHGRLIDVGNNGIFRRSEVIAKNGENWLVLDLIGEKMVVRSKPAKVKNLRSVSWPGDELDAKLSFENVALPTLAFRNIRGVKAGSINTLFFDRAHFDDLDEDVIPSNEEMSDGYIRHFDLNGTRYTLRTSTALSDGESKMSVLVLESETSKQILRSTRYNAEGGNIIGKLIWAGDLDNDGKLDLYFDRFNEVGAFSGMLFLSSHAKKNDLVDLVAVFSTQGC